MATSPAVTNKLGGICGNISQVFLQPFVVVIGYPYHSSTYLASRFGRLTRSHLLDALLNPYSGSFP
ncbi:hypothetical protein MJO28_007626 [Puccinia striiformis f. sp. tritici]|uniref:Uncharacterized protein n=1 Tax=Puccinia striiformis f. sp. tritici TaxID=168172 RepID=A0ACC0EHW5_9BASI|nr:hypothetical protein MJO28_007626 [Puccinia striiformis f. sp. tritici]